MNKSLSAVEKRSRELSRAVAAFSQGRAKPKPIDAKKNRDYLNKITGLNIPKKESSPKPFTFVARVEGGAPGADGAPGKDAVVNTEEITNAVIEKLKKDKPLVVSDLRDGQAFVFNNTKYQTSELMHGGSSSSGGTPANPDNSVQYNNGGSFGGSTLLFDESQIPDATFYTAVGAEGENGGDINLDPGDGDSSGTGGSFNLFAGVGGVTGNGGNVVMEAGMGGATSGAGGFVSLVAGAGIAGNSDGGDLGMNAGAAHGTGEGGATSIEAGNGGTTSGDGGGITLTAGSAIGGNSNGGDVVLDPGLKHGSGTDGNVKIQNGNASTYAILSTVSLTTVNRTFTFPDASGTFALNTAGATFVDNEVVGGATQTFTLANTPILGSQHIYGNGQRLTPGGVDYTIAGAVITTVNSFSAGQILADYRK